VLLPAERPLPVPAAGEVVIAQEAVGVNFVDTRFRRGPGSGGIFQRPLPGRPTGDVVGTVAQVDRQSGTITLQDGRQVKLGTQSVVWQAMPIDSIQPGAQIYVRNAQPLAMAAPQAYDPNVQVGTVKYVDQGARLIALTDGTYVKVNRDTRLESAGRPLTLAEVRSGDVVAVRPEGNTGAAHTGPSGTAGLGTKPATVARGDGTPVSAVQADAIEVRRPATTR
jgi:hypothetical protein